MKTTFNNRELCHIWAQQSQDKGKGSNMFFEEKSIYSYGHHFEIARFIDSDTILFTTDKYSVTTSKHMSYVRQAIPDYITVFNVPSFTDHKKNVEYFKSQVESALKSAATSHKYSDMYLNEANNTIKTLLHYISKFEIAPDKEVLEYERKYNAGELLNEETVQLIKQKESARKAKEMQRKKEDIDKWLNFEINSVSVPEVLLRTDGEEIETTLGAKVSINEGKQLYNAIRKNKPVHGFKIGYYTVTGYDGNVLTVGCHKLKTKEIDRFAATQKWI